MLILVLNCGSSSLKYTLFKMPGGEEIQSGLIDRLGHAEPTATWSDAEGAHEIPVTAGDHSEAVQWVSAKVSPELTKHPLDGIGHRIVHGGEAYSTSVIVTDQVEATVETLSALAPLHNPAHLEGIRAARACFPEVPQVAVFDTAFHQTLPDYAYRYALPTHLYERHGIRRYGFHGTSHRYVSERAARILEKTSFTGVTCHLGNGCSLAAIQDGQSIDTTMGLTPLGGVPMGTRSGDLDPAIVLHLQNRLNIRPEKIDDLLNRESGLLGMSGISNDLREIEEAAREGSRPAKLAIEVAAYQIAKSIGSYVGILKRADGIVFTGGIGENAVEMRQRIVDRLAGLDVSLDDGSNREVSHQETVISSADSKLKVLVIPTREEWVIARDTYDLIQPTTGLRAAEGDQEA